VGSNYNVQHVELYYIITAMTACEINKTETEYGQQWP
jgi:hypothetical protein